MRGFESHSFYFVDLPIQSMVSFILNTSTWYLLPLSMLLITQHIARVAKLSKALALVTSHFGGRDSSPTPVILLTFLFSIVSFILNTGTLYLSPSSMLLTTQHTGRMAEGSKALV